MRFSSVHLLLLIICTWMFLLCVAVSEFGYPRASAPQSPTSTTVLEDLFFMHGEDYWNKADFDYIVIGTGFCGYAFASRILDSRPHAKILMLERGPFFLPTHFQALPLAFQQTVMPAKLETYSWSLSKATHDGRWCKWIHGVAPFFGGRSTKWSAWCPTPTDEEMEGWPVQTIQANKKYIQSANKLLNVTSADRVFGTLQRGTFELLTEARKSVRSATITRIIPAPLSLADDSKFSTVGPLLSLVSQQQLLHARGQGAHLKISINCIVKRILQENGTATALETSKGLVPMGKAKLILATGTIPAAALVINSFPDAFNVGTKMTNHIISAVTARIPRTAFRFSDELGKNELGAFYIAGVDPKTGKQFHIQASVVSSLSADFEALSHLMPDVLTTASPQQLQESKDHVLFVFAILGQQTNQANWLKKNDEDGDPTTNVVIQALEEDSSVWDTMEDAAFQLLEAMHGDLQYYSQINSDWSTNRPSKFETRRPGLVHEASTLYLGEDESKAPVDLHYKLKNATNVFVTGGALWPESGSWNPTLTMVALTHHLADILDGNA